MEMLQEVPSQEREEDFGSLRPFFRPRSIAVIGATPDARKLGYVLARNVLGSDFGDSVFLINPKGGRILGRRVYQSLADLPGPVDLAVIMTPAGTMPDVLKDCVACSVHAAIINSGGFSEVGGRGRELEEKCVQIARAGKLRLLGPNCVGLIDASAGLDTTFLPRPLPPGGHVAFISHSGAVSAVTANWAASEGVGLSHIVSLGNQADVTETDVLEALANDDAARVLALYLEGVRDGRRFVEIASEVSYVKPIVALKVGRYEAGRRAVMSHTGALAGRDVAYDAAFRRAGIVRATNSEELLDWARVLARCQPMNGDRIAILTNAGGPGAAAADAAGAFGLRLPELDPSTTEALRARLPGPASVANPVDMLASATPEQYGDCLRILSEDSSIDGVVVILPPPPLYPGVEAAIAIADSAAGLSKPVVVAAIGGDLVSNARRLLRRRGIVDLPSPERAVGALSALQRNAAFRRGGLPVRLDRVDASKAASIFAALPEGARLLPPIAAADLVGAYGIARARSGVARTPEEAVELAADIGFPVVMKLVSPDAPHKVDYGGVITGVANPEQARQAFDLILKRADQHLPGGRVDGVLVQETIAGLREILAGAVRDEQFGVLSAFGSGGVDVEARGDVSFSLAPLTASDIEWMMEETGPGKQLRTGRGLARCDWQAAIDVVARLGQLAVDFPIIEEIEINPLIVRAEGKGAVAVDIRVVLGDRPGSAPQGSDGP
jgi:acetyltransferase